MSVLLLLALQAPHGAPHVPLPPLRRQQQRRQLRAGSRLHGKGAAMQVYDTEVGEVGERSTPCWAGPANSPWRSVPPRAPACHGNS